MGLVICRASRNETAAHKTRISSTIQSTGSSRFKISRASDVCVQAVRSTEPSASRRAM